MISSIIILTIILSIICVLGCVRLYCEYNDNDEEEINEVMIAGETDIV